jgi:hypothetical protein
MVKDVAPELLKKVQKEFQKRYNEHKLVQQSLTKDKPTYVDAHNYAVGTGESLAGAFQAQITEEDLPNGQMYYNIAERVVKPPLIHNHQLIARYTKIAQQQLNDQAGVRIWPRRPSLNTDRIDGLIDRLTEGDGYETVKWLLQAPVVNYSQSIVDDAIKENAEFHYESGLRPKIIRHVNPGACEWCRALGGTYDYKTAPPDIYRRHKNCTCKTEYDPGDGKIKNIWSKQERSPDDEEKQARIELSKQVPKETAKVGRKIRDKLTADQAQFYDEMIANAPEDVQKVWRKYQNELELDKDTKLKSTPHFNPTKNKVFMHIDDDIAGDEHTESGDTFFHEFGHQIDHLKTKTIARHGFSKYTTDLGQSIYEEVQANIKVQADKRVTVKRALLKQELMKDTQDNPKSMGSISDLYGGATNNKLRINMGHVDAYWRPPKMRGMTWSKDEKEQYRNYRLGSEGFAEMFSAEVRQSDEIEKFQKYLPKSYEKFKEMLKDLGG